MLKLNIYEVTEQSTSYKMAFLKVPFWPYMALRVLHFLLYPFKMSILAQIVHFLRLYIAHMTLTIQFMIR